MAVKGPNHQMRTRIRGLTVLFALIGFGLVGVRLLYMQVFNHDFYVQQATALQTRDTFITPNRGKIYDANMQVLAESALRSIRKPLWTRTRSRRASRRKVSSRRLRPSCPKRWLLITIP